MAASTTVVNPELGLRPPTIAEAREVDRTRWSRVFSLVDEHEWSLEQALHDITVIRGDIDVLMQPRPKVAGVQKQPQPQPRAYLALEDIQDRGRVPNVQKQHLKDKGKGKGKGKNGNRPSAFGSDFCKRWNLGKCTSTKCNYAHRCNYVLKNGRICGGNHPAAECPQRPGKH